MTNEEKQVAEWMRAFGQEVPDKPTIPSLEVRELRAKLILEEALETIVNGLGLMPIMRDFETKKETWRWHPDDEIEFDEDSETGPGPNLTEIADGCADLMVVTLGTKAACGLLLQDYKDSRQEEYDPIFNEVMRSNRTKLWTYEEAEKEFGCLTYEAYEDKMGFELPKPLVERADGWICRYTPKSLNGCWLVTDSSGKVIKSPSYSPANLEPFIQV